MTSFISDSNKHVVEIPQDNTLALSRVYRDPLSINEFPEEILSLFFENLSLQGIRACQLTCKEWNWILNNSDNDGLWGRLLKNHFPNVDVDRGVVENFHSAYKTLHNFYSNLIKGVCAPYVLQGHENTISCLAVDVNVDSRQLFSASFDRTIKAWDAQTGKCSKTLQGHTGLVYRLVADAKSRQLFSVSLDGTFKVWDTRTGKCRGTLQGHEGIVYCFTANVKRGLLFSGSSDRTIKVWDIQTGKCLRTLQEDRTDTGYCLVVEDNSGLLFSANSSGYTITVWDIQTGKYLRTLQGHEYTVTSLAVIEGQLFSGSSDRTIKVWDIQTGKYLRTLHGHTSAVTCLAVDDKRRVLFSVSLDRTIKAWDTRTGKCIGTLQRHENTGYCYSLAAIDGKLFLLNMNADNNMNMNADNNIELWDLTASQDTILQQMANMLKTGTTPQIQRALNLFSRMPNKVKNAIYGELYDICKPFANDYWGCGEHAFLNQYGQSSEPHQQAKAIESYLNKQKP